MSMSRDQLKQLGIAASAAVKHQRMVGMFEVPPDMRTASKTAQNEFWRHQQVAIATQRVCSFKDMADLRPQGGADEYQLVMQHFESLAGPFWKEKATTRTTKLIDGADCDRAPGCEYVRDMNHWLAKAGYQQGYAFAIAKAKFRGVTDLRLLRTFQLKQLHDTVVNRCRAKLGLGDPDSRNKKARLGDSEKRGLGDSNPPNPPVSKSPSLPLSTPQNGSPPAPSRSRDYVLKPRGQGTHVPRENIPF